MIQITKLSYTLSKRVILAFAVILASVIVQEFIELRDIRQQKSYHQILSVTGNLESLSQRLSLIMLRMPDTPDQREQSRSEAKPLLDQFKKESLILDGYIFNTQNDFSPKIKEIFLEAPYYLKRHLKDYIRAKARVLDALHLKESSEAAKREVTRYSTEVFTGLRRLREQISQDALRAMESSTQLKQLLILFDILSIFIMGVFVVTHLLKRLHREQISRREAEIQLTDQIEELETFSGVVAHDLRSPLHNIYLYGNMLLDSPEMKGKPEDDQVVKTVRVMVEQSEKLSHMIQSLLGFFKNSTKRITKTKVRLETLVSEVRDLLHAEIKSANALIDCPRSIDIYADESLMIRVIQNLVQNSLRYAGVEKPVVTITAKKLSYAYEITVADNGKGIEVDEMDAIFEPFRRGRAEKGSEGMGMGLAFVARVVRWHGGQVRVKNAPEGGAVFTIVIPKLT